MKRSNLTTLILSSIRQGDGADTIEMSYTSQDQIPQAYQNLYTEADGVWSLTGVVGIKTQDDVNRLQSALTKERNDHRTTRQKYSVLGDRDVNEILADLDRIPALEAGAKGGEDIEAQVAARVQQATAPLQRNLEQVTGERDNLTQQVQTFQAQTTQRTIMDELRAQAVKAKVLPEAMDDMIALGLSNFEIGETGQVIAKADVHGVTAGVSPEVWLTECRRQKPYFFPPVEGAGARGSQGGGSVSNPWHKDSWNLTEQGKILSSDRDKAEQLAKAAGTSIGGPKPQ